MFRSSNENDPVSQGASGAPHDRRGEQTARVPKRLRRGLDQLRRAYEYAIDLGADAWDFAIEIRELLAAGMTRSDLRWLVRKGWTLHAREVTLPGEETRDFHRSRGLIFTRRTCFVLTDAGIESVRQLGKHAPGKHKAVKTKPARPVAVPHWDSELQELYVGNQLIKRFKVPAPNQEMVLAAFEEEGWPVKIDDPLPPQPHQDSKRRLHDTINSLNRNHKAPLLRFVGDGTGTGVRWTLTDRDSDGEA